jgi:hypothetical protein
VRRSASNGAADAGGHSAGYRFRAGTAAARAFAFNLITRFRATQQSHRYRRWL